jgi:nicotinate-nucleotide--dimethylbenzimidazole phosphoribosyltransferase
MDELAPTDLPAQSTHFQTLDQLRDACLNLPTGNASAADAVRARQMQLTKPPSSLGRLEETVAWLAEWGTSSPPRLDRVDILVFAGNHGVTARGVSPFPAAVTAQMVSNFNAGGAAINQIARSVSAELNVIALDLDNPTADFTHAPAMDDTAFLAAVTAGYGAVRDVDVICLGEMGIGNTTAAAALVAGLFGGDGKLGAGRATEIAQRGLAPKPPAIDEALTTHAAILHDPLRAAAALGGRELAALLGAALAARHRRIPVLMDGFVCTAALAPLARLRGDALAHVLPGHLSAEVGHRALLEMLGLKPLLDLGMRLGEGSGAALAVSVLRAAVACYSGMSTFAEAGVANRPH